MKNAIILLISMLLISTTLAAQTSTKQQDAEKLIKKYMAENLNDFKSYEPINFSKIDTLKGKFFYTESSYNLALMASKAMQFYNDNVELAKMYKELGGARKELVNRVKSAHNMSLDLMRKILAVSYPNVPIGWVVIHKCRSIDKYGRVTLGEWIVGFDFDMKKIILVKSEFQEKDVLIADSYLLQIPALDEINSTIKSMVDSSDLQMKAILTDPFEN